MSFSWFESHRIWAAGLVVGEHCDSPSHWRQVKTLSKWMESENIPGICGIDTRALTKKLAEKGTMLGRIVQFVPQYDDLKPIDNPNERNLVAEVSTEVSHQMNLVDYFL